MPDDPQTYNAATGAPIDDLLTTLDTRLTTIGDSLSDLQAFPPAREPTASSTRARLGVAGGLGQVAERAIRDVLGHRVRAGDARGFAAALDQAFAPSTTAGYSHLVWRPRGYAVQADLGALTGAQASIYARARTALEESLKVLDALVPLSTSADPEDANAIRELVRGELVEVVDQLGAEGGPPVQLIDENLKLLIEYDPEKEPPVVSAADVAGQLGELRQRFGLRPERVNTIEEELNLTNFIILVDHVSSLTLSWHSQRSAFGARGSGVFFGTQLVQLSRSLDVVVESVAEVEDAMDSVLLGGAERQTLDLTFGGDAPSLTVAELLGWVERFASEEGPRVIQDSGKDGVEHDFTPKVTRLHDLVKQGMLDAPNPELPSAFRSKRVRSAIQQLAGSLERTQNGRCHQAFAAAV